ncbi:MAG: cytochrome c maturation protein CcmE [Meiothermus sp.]|nr:cytochrome c maturation protein CcmE [Meiothermus sp.]
MNTKLIVGLLVIGGALAYLIFGGLGQNLVYFITPSEYFQQEAKYQNRQVRLGGLVKAQTINYNRDSLELRFTVSDGVREIPVLSKGSTPPALFGENRGVVVEGRFDGETFVSQNLLVKHSESYSTEKHNYTPEEIRKLLEEAN